MRAFCCYCIAGFVVVSHALGASSDHPDYRNPFPLPACPPGAVIVLYGPLPRGMMGSDVETATDWKPYLMRHRIEFPIDGFALFYRPGRIVAVATDKKNHELLERIFE